MSLTLEPTISTSNLSSNLSSNETNTTIVYWTTAYAHASAIVNIFLGVLGLASNGIVFFSVVARPKLRTIDNVLLANVALIELLYFATSHPIAIWATFRYGDWRDDDDVCQANAYFNATLLPLCWIAHAVLSFEKFYRVWYAIKRKSLTMFQGLTVIIVSWAVCLGISTAPFFGQGRYKVLQTRLICGPNYGNPIDPIGLYSTIVLLLCWAVTFACYLCICIVVVRNRKKDRARRSMTGSFNGVKVSEEEAARQRRRESVEVAISTTQTSFTVFISVILYTVVFIIPIMVQVIIHHGREGLYQGYGSSDFNISAFHLFLVNVLLVVNPLIYSLRTKKLRDHLVKITKTILRCRGNDSNPS
ncbi:rhodopsin-like [Oscarella lobularis]|uniref:rhodopsin-like n=1 Tax=Oscarella lobularis TaxID=121494 RepID=UPI00331428FF